MMKLKTYAGFSFLASVTVIYHAFNSRGQFYPAMNYLSTSKICFVCLLNTGLVIMCIMWQLVKRLFLGRLREAEVERLNEQAWREVMEVLFAITIFRRDFSVTFLGMVTTLLLIKTLHWLAQKRVEYIETTPSVPMLSHVRIVSFMGFLLALDCLFLYSSLKSLIQTWQASVALFFSFEYTILATTTVATFVKYVFYVSDMLMEGQWERKAVYTFYLELVRDLLHLSLYIFFFLVIFANYGVPLHLIRDLYETFRNFRIRVADYMRYRKITSNMNERFADATAEELNASDATCIICREEMVTAKKLLCGHLFHVHCLRSWLERQHTCPTCRALVVSENGSVASGRQHIIPPDSRQPTDSAITGTSTQVSEGDALGDNSSQMQLRARFHVAALAASIYGKSFVYPPENTFAWSSEYALVPQIKEPREAAASGPSQQHQLGGGIGEVATSVTPQQNPLILYTYPLPSMFLQAAGTSSRNVGSPNFEGSFLRAQESFIQSQIESLQAQLQAMQQQTNQSKTARGDADPAVADYKGKAVAASTSDSGHHGEMEDANNN